MKRQRRSIVLACLALIAVQQAAGIGGPSWPIKFRQNAQTLPSIEVKLSPPDDPLPQVTAEILLLDRGRLDLEEGLMAKLEDQYNEQLDNAQIDIEKAVEKAMSIFNDPAVLQGAIKGSIIQQSNNNEGYPSISSSQLHLLQIDSPQQPPFTSFLQTQETSLTQNRIIGDVVSAALAPPPAVKIQLTDVKEPDPQIKEKIEEIEQLRADEETKMFDQAATEFRQLTRITIAELEKNIQIQLNPFLVDREAVAKAMKLANSNSTASYKSILPSFQQDDDTKETIAPVTSFLQLSNSSTLTQQLKFGLAKEKQLNVRIAQSDKPYPTIDEIVSDMQKKRDATERLERMKIMQLQMKLLKAEGEMIKDALHTNVARILAQFAPAIEAIKAKSAEQELST